MYKHTRAPSTATQPRPLSLSLYIGELTKIYNQILDCKLCKTHETSESNLSEFKKLLNVSIPNGREVPLAHTLRELFQYYVSGFTRFAADNAPCLILLADTTTIARHFGIQNDVILLWNHGQFNVERRAQIAATNPPTSYKSATTNQKNNPPDFDPDDLSVFDVVHTRWADDE